MERYLIVGKVHYLVDVSDVFREEFSGKWKLFLGAVRLESTVTSWRIKEDIEVWVARRANIWEFFPIVRNV